MLVRHPHVREAAVVGLPDPVNGEEVVAAVVARTGIDTIDVGDLDAHCAGALARYKRPRIVVVEELPRNATGKVNRRELKALLAEGSR